MKGNLTGLYAMLLGGLYLGILAFLVVKLLGWGVEIRSVFLCLFVLFSFGNFAFGRLSRQAGAACVLAGEIKKEAVSKPPRNVNVIDFGC